MNKFWIVLKREYLTRVSKKSFILLTILSPLIMVAIVAVPMILGMNAKDKSEKRVVVVDQTGKYYGKIAEAPRDGFVFTDEKNGDIGTYRQQGKEEAPYAIVVITEDLIANPRAITIYTHSSIPPTLSVYLQDVLREELRAEKIASYDIPELEKILDDTKVILNISTVQWDESGDEKESSSTVAMVVGQIFNVCIFMFVMMYGSMVMQSVTEEKKNRIVEIIASSVKPTVLLFAKIIAIGLLGITQVVLWGILLTAFFLIGQVFIFNSATLDLSQLQQTAMTSGDFDPAMVREVMVPLMNFDFTGVIIAFIFFFVFAYVSYSCLFAAAGAAMDSDEDVQQLIMPITLLMVFGFYAAIYSMENPNGPLAVWGSFIPFIAPNVMMVRLPFDPPAWQVMLSVVVMVVSSAFFVWVAAKIFRVGLLMYGKKPTFKELIRWICFK